MIEARGCTRTSGCLKAPSGARSKGLLHANRGDTATQIRNYVMLVLLAVYGFRSGEVRGLKRDERPARCVPLARTLPIA
jgi:hypothetical protein